MGMAQMVRSEERANAQNRGTPVEPDERVVLAGWEDCEGQGRWEEWVMESNGMNKMG